MVALDNDRTGGALFFFPYLLPFSSLYPSFFFSFCSPIGATMHIASVSNKYLMQNWEERSGYTLALSRYFRLGHSCFHSILDA
jgi:hypothetical protein